MPKIAKAAGYLSELKSHVLMAKVDAERYPKVALNLAKGFLLCFCLLMEVQFSTLYWWIFVGRNYDMG
ncbi:putative protein disulfide-isomerase [Helianthus anomalus]